MGSIPVAGAKNSKSTDLEFFYPLRKQLYIVTRQRVYHQRRLAALISYYAEVWIQKYFRNDDIQNLIYVL